MRIDREMHLVAGCFISFVALIFFEAIHAHWMWVVGTVVGAAIFKELKDLHDYGKFDIFDALYTIAGGSIGIALAIFT
jgi:predicted branched-subunit amino acid permease